MKLEIYVTGGRAKRVPVHLNEEYRSYGINL